MDPRRTSVSKGITVRESEEAENGEEWHTVDQTEALIIETIDRHREEILEFARDIYSHAELGYKEFQTSGKFVKKMEQLGLRTEKGFAITGVKAYLNEDKKENASLALLGELDALRIPEHAL